MNQGIGSEREKERKMKLAWLWSHGIRNETYFTPSFFERKKEVSLGDQSGGSPIKNPLENEPRALPRNFPLSLGSVSPSTTWINKKSIPQPTRDSLDLDGWLTEMCLFYPNKKKKFRRGTRLGRNSRGPNWRASRGPVTRTTRTRTQDTHNNQ